MYSHYYYSRGFGGRGLHTALCARFAQWCCVAITFDNYVRERVISQVSGITTIVIPEMCRLGWSEHPCLADFFLITLSCLHVPLSHTHRPARAHSGAVARWHGVERTMAVAPSLRALCLRARRAPVPCPR